MDCKKTIWQKVSPVLPASKLPMPEFPTLTTTELAQWTVRLDEVNETGVVVDPIAIEALKDHYAKIEHDHALFEREAATYTTTKAVLGLINATLKIVVASNRAAANAARRDFARRDLKGRTSAPKIGWTILAIVCDREDLERSAGDLEEWYPIYLRERGRVATNIWYWAQITRTVMNRLWPAVERALKLAELFSKVRSG